MVSVDGIVAMMLFIVFVTWSVSYYANAFAAKQAEPMQSLIDSMAGRLEDYLSVDVYEVPVKFSADNSTSGMVLSADYAWPSEGAKNSTVVLKAGSMLPCNITGSRIYWQTDAASGDNYFTIKYTNKTGAMNCTGGFSTGLANKTIPWSAVKRRAISSDKVSEMAGMDFAGFREAAGVDREFWVEINASGDVTQYGLIPPNISNVYVRAIKRAMEDGGQADIRLLAW